MKIDAVIWDYDGTLVDSTKKNMEVTKQIFNAITPRLAGLNLPSILKSEEEYQKANHAAKNWQDLYLNYYGLTEKETVEAGKLWTEFQLKNNTPVELFPHVSTAVDQIKCPQGICSQNSERNIKKLLSTHELQDKFTAIVGYDDIPDNAQKPLPDSGIICLERIFEVLENKVIMFIGDHQSDVRFARNVATKINKTNRIIAAAVNYSGADINSWIDKPDIVVSNPLELVELTN